MYYQDFPHPKKVGDMYQQPPPAAISESLGHHRQPLRFMNLRGKSLNLKSDGITKKCVAERLLGVDCFTFRMEVGWLIDPLREQL